MGATCCGADRKILTVEKRRLLGEKDEASFSFEMPHDHEEKKVRVKKKTVAKKVEPPKQEPPGEDTLTQIMNQNGRFIVRKPGQLS
jgi:hypothetical protein